MTNLLESHDRQVSYDVPIFTKPLFYHISLTVALVTHLLQYGSITAGPHFNEKSLKEVFIVFYGWKTTHLSFFIKYHES